MDYTVNFTPCSSHVNRFPALCSGENVFGESKYFLASDFSYRDRLFLETQRISFVILPS